MKKRKTDFFWPSYADLMTSLFFIMLVLFVFADIKSKKTNKELEEGKKATEEQLSKIKEMKESVEKIDSTYFRYDSINKRFSLKQKINFPENKSDINDNDTAYLLSVGRELQRTLDSLKQNNKLNATYVLILEGMASRDKKASDAFNYALSYKRALAVKNLWDDRKIDFDTSFIDVQIAGSGISGIGRSEREEVNQQILIHIIPKIGEIK